MRLCLYIVKALLPPAPYNLNCDKVFPLLSDRYTIPKWDSNPPKQSEDSYQTTPLPLSHHGWVLWIKLFKINSITTNFIFENPGLLVGFNLVAFPWKDWRNLRGDKTKWFYKVHLYFFISSKTENKMENFNQSLCQFPKLLRGSQTFVTCGTSLNMIPAQDGGC